MTLVDNLITLMQEKGINRAELARGSGVPYTTIVAIFEKGADNIKLSTLRKLADYFGITLDELAAENREAEQNLAEDDLSEAEILTLAAHSTGHTGKLSEEDLQKIKLAVKIALARHGDN